MDVWKHSELIAEVVSALLRMREGPRRVATATADWKHSELMAEVAGVHRQ